MGNMGGDESAGSGEKKHDIGAASGAVTRNASASGAGVETVLQVPPPAALVEEPGTTYMPMGMGMEMGVGVGVGGQSRAEPSKKQLGPIDGVERSFLSCTSVNLFNY
jgi:hypothetical protein